MAPFHCVRHGRGDKLALWGLFYKGTDPNHEGFTLKHTAKEKISKLFYQTEEIIQNSAQRDKGKMPKGG